VTNLLTMALWKVDYPVPNHRQRHQGPSACMPQLRVQTPLFPCKTPNTHEQNSKSPESRVHVSYYLYLVTDKRRLSGYQ
jgi:hypothetical protein